MACKRGSPGGARLDRRARTAADKSLGRFDIAGAREMIKMGAEVAVGRAGEALQPGEVEPLLGSGRARSAPP